VAGQGGTYLILVIRVQSRHEFIWGIANFGISKAKHFLPSPFKTDGIFRHLPVPQAVANDIHGEGPADLGLLQLGRHTFSQPGLRLGLPSEECDEAECQCTDEATADSHNPGQHPIN